MNEQLIFQLHQSGQHSDIIDCRLLSLDSLCLLLPSAFLIGQQAKLCVHYGDLDFSASGFLQSIEYKKPHYLVYFRPDEADNMALRTFLQLFHLQNIHDQDPKQSNTEQLAKQWADDYAGAFAQMFDGKP